MVLTLFVLLCMLSPQSAHATLASCQKTKKSSVAACNGALTNAVKNSSTNAAAVSAACSAKDAKGNSKRGISQCADDMKNSGGLSNSLLDDATKICDTQQKSCDSACNPASVRPEEKSAVSSLKQACKKEIDAAKAQAAAGKKGGDQAQDGAEKTKESSQNDSMPQMPQSQGGEGGGDSPALGTPQTVGSAAETPAGAQTPANAPPAAAFAKSCNYDSAGYDSRCTEALSSKCNEEGERNSEMCKTFRAAFCTRGGSVPAGFGENALKLGSGIGSDFCQKSLEAYKNETQAQLKTAGGTSAATGGGMAAGGGSAAGAGAGGGAAAIAPDVKAPTDEDGASAAGSGGGTDGGAGGGYTYGGGNGGSGEYAPESLALGNARRSIAAAEQADSALVPGYKDVAYSPNVFSILGGVYRNHCQKGRALHCGPEKK